MLLLIDFEGTLWVLVSSNLVYSIAERQLSLPSSLSCWQGCDLHSTNTEEHAIYTDLYGHTDLCTTRLKLFLPSSKARTGLRFSSNFWLLVFHVGGHFVVSLVSSYLVQAGF